MLKVGDRLVVKATTQEGTFSFSPSLGEKVSLKNPLALRLEDGNVLIVTSSATLFQSQQHDEVFLTACETAPVKEFVRE